MNQASSQQVGRFGLRKHPVVLGFGLAGLAGVGIFFGWAFYATGKMGNGWRDLAPIWPYVLGGAVFTALLTGGLMWSAFYSADHGYDDRADVKDSPPETRP